MIVCYIALCCIISALHHNNCMFVAHHIQTIERQFCKKLAQLPAPDRHANLGDLIPRIRKLGNSNFTQQILIKKEQICDYLILAEGKDMDYLCMSLAAQM